MKTKTNHLFSSSAREDEKIINSDAIIFNDYQKEVTKGFTAADLWDIQRRRRMIRGRKFYE